jgi:hypothetical protein
MTSEQEHYEKIYTIFKKFPNGIWHDYKEDEDSDDPGLDRLNVLEATYKDMYADVYIDVPFDSLRFHLQIDLKNKNKNYSAIAVFRLRQFDAYKQMEKLVKLLHYYIEKILLTIDKQKSTENDALKSYLDLCLTGADITKYELM